MEKRKFRRGEPEKKLKKREMKNGEMKEENLRERKN